MGRHPVLDKKLVAKIAKKLGKPNLNIVKAVSAMASRKGIASESALILFARKYKVGAATANVNLVKTSRLRLDRC